MKVVSNKIKKKKTQRVHFYQLICRGRDEQDRDITLERLINANLYSGDTLSLSWDISLPKEE